MTVPAAALFFTLIAIRQPSPLVTPGPIHNAIARVTATLAPDRTVAPAANSQRHVSKAGKIAAGVLGGVAGFYGGAYVGAAIGGLHDCGCDDPGLGGALMGAPVGAIAGAMFGTWLVSR
jgi:hypothetical protein